MVLLDFSMLEAGGMRFAKRLSDEFGVPVIALSGMHDEENIARALDLGADDYIVKPYSANELNARVRASLRKRSLSRKPDAKPVYSKEKVTVNCDARTLTVSGRTVQSTVTEYKLLYEFSNNACRFLTRDELLCRVWGPEYYGEPKLLRSYVKSLRQKLDDDARNPTYVFTEHGKGYRTAEP